MSSRLWQQPLQGADIFEAVFAGNFLPEGSSAPKTNSPAAGKWTVARSGTGTFLVTLFGATGRVLNFQASLQLDQAGSDLHLQVTPGLVSSANGRVTLQFLVQDTTTGALTDITQPVSPDAQGSAVHFIFVVSDREPLALGSL